MVTRTHLKVTLYVHCQISKRYKEGASKHNTRTLSVLWRLPVSQHCQGDTYFAIGSRMALGLSAPLALVRQTDCSPLSTRSVGVSSPPLHPHPHPHHIPWWRAVTNLCAVFYVVGKRRILFTVDRCLKQPYFFLINSFITA